MPNYCAPAPPPAPDLAVVAPPAARPDPQRLRSLARLALRLVREDRAAAQAPPAVVPEAAQ
jgi:hypothetical protein